MKKILLTLIILGGLIVFFLLTTPGLDTLKRLPDAHKDASWAPFTYYNIARIQAGMGRTTKAAEIYEQMLNIYDDDYLRKGQYAPFVKNELSKHYMPYALFQCGSCYERTADNEYNLYTVQRKQGQDKEAAESLDKARKDYDKAMDLFNEFIDRFNYHPLYSEANRLHNEAETKYYSLPPQ